MSGRRWLSDAAQAEIGRQVRLARAGGASWKMLERTYDRDRHTLQRYAETEECTKIGEECTILGISARAETVGV